MLDALDALGDHFVTYRKHGLTMRHNAQGDAWSLVLASGGIPADILLTAWDKGTDVCVDLTITSPLGPPPQLTKSAMASKQRRERKENKANLPVRGNGLGAPPSGIFPVGQARERRKKKPSSSWFSNRPPPTGQGGPRRIASLSCVKTSP